MKQIFIIIAALIFLYSCKKETDLMNSVYIEDADIPGMPAYTEWGYNTFGAFYGRDLFTYTDKEVPLYISVDNNIINFIFQGQYRGNYMSVNISYPEYTIKSHSDLLLYNGRKINLLDDNGIIVINKQSSDTSKIVSDTVKLISGSIEFNRVQNVFIDDKEELVILSGYFNFQFFDNNIPVSVHDGRFDIGVNESVFFLIP